MRSFRSSASHPLPPPPRPFLYRRAELLGPRHVCTIVIGSKWRHVQQTSCDSVAAGHTSVAETRGESVPQSEGHSHRFDHSGHGNCRTNLADQASSAQGRLGSAESVMLQGASGGKLQNVSRRTSLYSQGSKVRRKVILLYQLRLQYATCLSMRNYIVYQCFLGSAFSQNIYCYSLLWFAKRLESCSSCP